LREINKEKPLYNQKLKGSVPKTKRSCQKAKKGFIMKKNKGYFINENEISLTKAYAKMAYTPGTKEFREFSALLKAYPHLTVVKREAAKSVDKEKHTGLSIPRMDFIIKNYVRDEDAIAEFEAVKDFYKGTDGYYGKVKSWFLKHYPNYKEYGFADVA
jgi:hypothetical protein